MPGEHLAPPRTPAQRARTPRATGEAISPSYPTALTRRKPTATRLCRALAFTYAARRDRARTDGCCLSSSQVRCSRYPPRAAMIPGSLRTASSSCFEWCAARAVRPPLTRTHPPAARSHPRRSAAATARLAAVERTFASLDTLSPIHVRAGRSDYAIIQNQLAQDHM